MDDINEFTPDKRLCKIQSILELQLWWYDSDALSNTMSACCISAKFVGIDINWNYFVLPAINCEPALTREIILYLNTSHTHTYTHTDRQTDTRTDARPHARIYIYIYIYIYIIGTYEYFLSMVALTECGYIWHTAAPEQLLKCVLKVIRLCAYWVLITYIYIFSFSLCMYKFKYYSCHCLFSTHTLWGYVIDLSDYHYFHHHHHHHHHVVKRVTMLILIDHGRLIP